jgi:uncharacterized membrane protein YbjE (DUF340 family)
MIQRLQSLYLLFAALFVGLFLVVGDAWYQAVGPVYPWATLVATVLCGLTVLVALVAVFFYKNRQTQRTVVRAAQWLDLLAVLVVVGCVIGLSFGNEAGLGTAATSVYLTLLLPVVGYVFLRLALRGVEKDIALVRSMDRLR